MKKITLLFICISLLACHFAMADSALASNPRVALETSMGVMVIELYPDKAPISVKNFLTYVRDGFYDGAIFHRVIKGFMIQGGGFADGMIKKATRPPIENEADNGLKNLRYTVALARTGDPHSATSQFFINAKTNPFLDHKAKDARGWGYCVFGKVAAGMDVAAAIESVKTTTQGSYRNVPVKPVVIRKARVVEKENKTGQ